MLKVLMLYGQEGGVEYYRLLQPAKYLNRLSLCECKTVSMGKGQGIAIMRSDKKHPDAVCLEELGEWADLIVSTRVSILENLSMLSGLRHHYKIPLVCEIDDDVTCMDRDHMNYKSLRRKDPADFAERIRIKRADYGDYEKRYRIVDKADIGGHADEMMIMTMKELDAEWVANRQVEVADAVTTTTEGIRESYENVNKNIYILKNCIDFELWDVLYPPPHEKIRIGWAGGAQHNKDLDIIVPVVQKILDKYPNTEFHYSVCVSEKMADLHRQNRDRIHKYEWVENKAWPRAYNDYSFDIALAPVTQTKFNQGKSNLKWLENSARKIPTVASRWTTYEAIKEGETGFLAETRDEWVEKVSKLVESEELRRTIGMNAYEEVKKNYNARDNAFDYAKAYNEIKANYKENDHGLAEFLKSRQKPAECELGITT